MHAIANYSVILHYKQQRYQMCSHFSSQLPGVQNSRAIMLDWDRNEKVITPLKWGPHMGSASNDLLLRHFRKNDNFFLSCHLHKQTMQIVNQQSIL